MLLRWSGLRWRGSRRRSHGLLLCLWALLGVFASFGAARRLQQSTTVVPRLESEDIGALISMAPALEAAPAPQPAAAPGPAPQPPPAPPPPPALYEGAVRLSELSPTALEVYHLGRWGPIAGPFTGLGALVACQQLGYPSGRAVAASLPPGAPMPAAADVTCSGREASLAECQGTEYVAEEPPATVAGVMCGNDTDAVPDYQVRLSDSCTSGRVEVALGGFFGAVCLADGGGDPQRLDALAERTAKVVCRGQGLGDYPLVSYSTQQTPYEGLPIWMDRLACTGGEESVAFCPHRSAPETATACTHLSVNCVPAAQVANATATMCTRPVGRCQTTPAGCSQGFCHWLAEPAGTPCGESGVCDAQGNCRSSGPAAGQMRSGRLRPT